MMSAFFNGSTCYLKRTTNLPTITSATIMGWAYQTVDPVPSVLMYSFGNIADDSAYWMLMQDTINQALTVLSGAGAYDTASTIIALNTWNHFAITVAGTGAGQVLGYLNGALNITSSGGALPTAAALVIGCYRDGVGAFFTGRMAGIKVYSAALNAGEVATEYASFPPVRTSNLNGYYPMTTLSDVAIDYSGSGNNWTSAGTYTTEGSPPKQLACVSNGLHRRRG